METITIKEAEGAMPVKNEVQHIRTLDAQGNPSKIAPQNIMEKYGTFIPVVTQNNNGLVPAMFDMQYLYTNSKKYVFLHKSHNANWAGFSFLFSISAGSSGTALLYISGGVRDSAATAECDYTILSDSTFTSFKDYAKIMYKANPDKSIEIYLVSIGENLGGRHCSKINLYPFKNSANADSKLKTVDTLDEGTLQPARTKQKTITLESANRKIADLEARIAKLEGK